MEGAGGLARLITFICGDGMVLSTVTLCSFSAANLHQPVPLFERSARRTGHGGGILRTGHDVRAWSLGMLSLPPSPCHSYQRRDVYVAAGSSSVPRVP